MRTYKLEIDLFRKSQYIPTLKQGDDTTLSLHLYARGAVYTIPTGNAFTLNALLLNDTVVIQQTGITVSTNVVTVLLDSHAVAVAGTLYLELLIIDTLGKVTSTLKIEALVEASLVSEDTVDSAVHDEIIDALILSSKAPYFDETTHTMWQFNATTGLMENTEELEIINDLTTGGTNKVTSAEVMKNFNRQIMLKSNEIKGTKQTMTVDTNYAVQRILHTDTITLATVRDDVFTYNENVVTEVRTLATGETLTLVHNLDTLETTIA